MRLLLLSDLHHEFWGDQAPSYDLAVSRPDAILLAGDIHSGSLGVEWAAKTFPDLPVLYVMGNHEAYGRCMENTIQELRDASLQTRNVHFLQCDEVIIGSVRFLGCTLWTDFTLYGEDRRELTIRLAEAGVKDYARIRIGPDGRNLRAADTAAFHVQQREWLANKLSEPFEGKTVVITHMAPSMRSVHERYAHDLLSAAFASSLDALAEQAHVWCHGHVHNTVDRSLGECRLMANPLGFPMGWGRPDNADFDPNFIITV